MPHDNLIQAVLGSLGSGKTLYLTYLAYKYYNKTWIYSNYDIHLPNCKKVNINEIEKLESGILLVDEAYKWADSRLAGSDSNRFFTSFVMESRKKGLNLIFSVQTIDMIDKRLRNQTIIDNILVANGEHKSKSPVDKQINATGDYLYDVVNPINLKKIKTMRLKARLLVQLFQIYDTTEQPDNPTPTQYEHDSLNDKINHLIDMLKEEYDNPEKLTKGELSDVLLEKGVSTGRIHKRVWNRIKRKQKEREDKI